MSVGPQEERTMLIRSMSATKAQSILSVNSSMVMMPQQTAPINGGGINVSQTIIPGSLNQSTLQNQGPSMSQGRNLQNQFLQVLQESRPAALQRVFTSQQASLPPSYLTGGNLGQPPNQQTGTNFYQGLTSQTGVYQLQRQQDEIKSLRLIIDKLTSKLRDYQLATHLSGQPPSSSSEEGIADLLFMAQDDTGAATPAQLAVTSTLGGHLLGPLFMEYEGTIRQLERELRDKTMEITRQGEDMRTVIKENDELAQRLEVQQREYLKLVEETRDNADILAMRSVGVNGGSSPRGGYDEVKELRERIHLLTEENQALFEQVTLLRAHFDGFNRDCQLQIEEASAKSASFDLLSSQLSKLIDERDRLLADKLDCDRRLQETLRIAAAVEDERRADQLELTTIREQSMQFRNEYVQYKAEAQRLAMALQSAEEQLGGQVRVLGEKDRDQQVKIQELEAINNSTIFSLNN